jgi:hypothetical protein
VPAAAAADLVEDFAADAMFTDIDEAGADTCGDETTDSVRATK